MKIARFFPSTVRTTVILLWAGGCGSSASESHDVVDANAVITLDRSVCYGTCPSYSLSIVGDGTVTYGGRKYVKLVGSANSQIPVSDVQGLVDEMEQANYFDLSVPKDCPEGIWTDMPSATTSLTIAGKSHEVEDYHGNPCAPAVLRTLEDRIDAVAQSAQWVECEGTGNCAM